MKFHIDYERALNPAQLEAVMTLDGPLLVVAGAGSGKTRTLVYRVAYLVERGVPPESILLLTFTRKAATEMLDRAAGIASEGCLNVSGGTFHALANRILRAHADRIGFPNGFTILDRADMEQIITSLIPHLNFSRRPPRFPKRGTIANILSKAANLQEPVSKIVNKEYPQFSRFESHLEKIKHLYSQYKRDNGLVDYDDLIIFLRDLLSHHPDVREQVGMFYRYVMVDEYQDTNRIQAEIVLRLAGEHGNIMAVGDDCQSIYSFRGANYMNMFDFPEQFPGTKLIRLEENYRSTQPILDFTNTMMEQAEKQYTKCLFTKRAGGHLPLLVEARTEPEQAAFVCLCIKEQLHKGRSLSDMAVLFRAGFHSFELETQLTHQGIPYVKYGGFKFLESAHIKDLLAHLRVMRNKKDAVSWTRVLTLVKNIGPAKANKIFDWIQSEGALPYDLLKWPGANSKDIKALTPLVELFESISRDDLSPYMAVSNVIEYYTPIMEQRFDDYPKREKDLDQLLAMSRHHENIETFLDLLLLDPPSSTMDLDPVKKEGDFLTLSTVHSAKGLEWPVVFIISAKDGMFPSPMAFKNPQVLEEERRLMYVAATRAKEELVICFPRENNTQSWQTDLNFGNNGPSVFIQAVPSHLFRFKSLCVPGSFSSSLDQAEPCSVQNMPASGEVDKSDIWQQGKSFENSRGIFKGARVMHPAFGQGIVFRFVGDDKVEVIFEAVGKKLLHMEYTHLEPIQ